MARVSSSQLQCLQVLLLYLWTKEEEHLSQVVRRLTSCIKETASEVETAILIHDCIGGILHEDIFIYLCSLKHCLNAVSPQISMSTKVSSSLQVRLDLLAMVAQLLW